MTGAQVAMSKGVSVLPAIAGDELSSTWSDQEFINAVCAAIPVYQRQEAIAALLSLVGGAH
jgi:hypothetical protein